jgi:uncharacterized protein with GYD domain
MPTYVLLMKWTDEAGIPSPGELEDAFGGNGGDPQDDKMFERRKEMIETALTGVEGGDLATLLWTLGEHDMVAIVKAASNEEIGGFSLFLSGEFGVRTITMPAFEPNAMKTIGNVAARCGHAVHPDAGPH